MGTMGVHLQRHFAAVVAAVQHGGVAAIGEVEVHIAVPLGVHVIRRQIAVRRPGQT